MDTEPTTKTNITPNKIEVVIKSGYDPKKDRVLLENLLEANKDQIKKHKITTKGLFLLIEL